MVPLRTLHESSRPPHLESKDLSLINSVEELLDLHANDHSLAVTWCYGKMLVTALTKTKITDAQMQQVVILYGLLSPQPTSAQMAPSFGIPFDVCRSRSYTFCAMSFPENILCSLEELELERFYSDEARIPRHSSTYCGNRAFPFLQRNSAIKKPNLLIFKFSNKML